MDFKSYFALPNDVIYLNTPGNGLLPVEHHIWRSQRELDFFDVRSDLRDQQPAFIAEVKIALGRLFNCKAANVYAVPNFSFGMHAVLAGLPPRSRILLLEGDYPSLNYPVLSKGFDFNFIALDENVEERIYAHLKLNECDVLMLSLVQYIGGLKIDLAFIKQLKKDFPELLVIGDATQFLGTESFDFKDSGFDVIGGSGYKWMMAGFGNGYIMLSDNIKEILYKEAQAGQRPQEAMWSYKSIIDTFFEPGHQDTLAHGTLLKSVEFMESLGLDNIASHLQFLRAYAYDVFGDRGWMSQESKNRKIQSSLINVQIDPQLYPKLLAKGVKCFPRGTGVRIGLHIYNSKEDIDNFVEIVDKISRNEI